MQHALLTGGSGFATVPGRPLPSVPCRAARPGRAGGSQPCVAAVLSLRPRAARRRGRALGPVCVRSSPVFGTQYSKNAPLTAWSPIRSLLSLGKFFIITTTATTSAWYAHPYLLNLAAHVLHLDFKDSVTAFQTSFFSFLSLVFAIYSGNTMAFLYDRQKEMVKMLYNETMALEELLEEAVNTLGPDARDILAQIRQYIDEEIFHPENQTPPLGEGFALAAIRSKARNYRRAGTDVGDILQASQRLAHAQSERQATACRLLPPVHWALLYTIGMLFVSTFILFETGGSFSNEGRHILFTVLCGLMSFVLCALRDLADPAEGVYNATALLGDRLTFIGTMLDKYQKLPGRTSAPTSNMVAGLPVPASVEEAPHPHPHGLGGSLAGMMQKMVSDTSAEAPEARAGSNGRPTEKSVVMSEVETRGGEAQELVSATMLTSQRIPEGQTVSKEAASRGVTDIIKVPALQHARTFRLGSLQLPPHFRAAAENGAISTATGRPFNLPVTAAVTYKLAPGQNGHSQRHPVVHAHHSGRVASLGSEQRFPLEGRAPLSELAAAKALTHAKAAADDWQAVAVHREGQDKQPQPPLLLL